MSDRELTAERGLQRIDNAATAALYLVGMLHDRLEDQSAHEDDLQLIAALEALLQRIEALCDEVFA